MHTSISDEKKIIQYNNRQEIAKTALKPENKTENNQISVNLPLITRKLSRRYQNNLNTITLIWNTLLDNIKVSKNTKTLEKAACEQNLLA